MAIKRNREEIIDFESSIAMANYLILLSSGPGQGLTGTTGSVARSTSPHRQFECKTCNRKFPSFQALGGHRASHKKPKPESRLDNGSDHTNTSLEMGHNNNNNNNSSGQKPKTAHECSICGVEFAIGQALGGHMRRHRAVLTGSLPADLSLSLASSGKLSGVSKRSRKNDGHDLDHDQKGVKCLDLNLTPLENGLLEIGMVSPILC